MINIVIVNGFPRSGKTLFTNNCIKELKEYGFTISTIDFVKHIARNCGWNGEKTPKDRKFLSDLKRLLVDWGDVPYRKIEEAIDYIRQVSIQYNIASENFFLFVDSREPEEIKRFKDEYGAITVLIDRDEVKTKQSNDSDNDVENFEYDYIIKNNGSLKEFQDASLEFLNTIKNKMKEGNNNE